MNLDYEYVTKVFVQGNCDRLHRFLSEREITGSHCFSAGSPITYVNVRSSMENAILLHLAFQSEAPRKVEYNLFEDADWYTNNLWV